MSTYVLTHIHDEYIDSGVESGMCRGDREQDGGGGAAVQVSARAALVSPAQGMADPLLLLLLLLLLLGLRRRK